MRKEKTKITGFSKTYCEKQKQRGEPAAIKIGECRLHFCKGECGRRELLFVFAYRKPFKEISCNKYSEIGGIVMLCIVKAPCKVCVYRTEDNLGLCTSVK